MTEETPRLTLEKFLTDLGYGQVIKDKYPCRFCGYEHPAWALVVDEDEDIVCGNCLLDDHREVLAIEAAAEIAALPLWETPLGVGVKVDRNMRIERFRWAADPVTSPLSEACQAEWREYIRLLNRLTLDFLNPEEVVWPVEPGLAYPQEET